MNSILDQRHSHSAVPTLAMPIGGIGTGGLAVHADGSLRQWQLHGVANHTATLPLSGFWVRTSREEPPLNKIALLRGAPIPDPGAPLVTDGHVPTWMDDASERMGTFSTAHFSGTYPIAQVDFADEDVPLGVRMTVMNPMQPLDEDLSSIPVAMFEIKLTNDGPLRLHGTLAGSLLNAVGWDGMTPIGEATPGLGGNVNRLARGRGWTRIVMDNASRAEHQPGQGQMVLAVDDPMAAALPRCGGIEHLEAFLESRAYPNGRSILEVAPSLADYQLHSPQSFEGPSPAGRTWLGVVAVPFNLEPGESKTVRFSMAWHFPNRYVDTDQFGITPAALGASKFWIGNHYGTQFVDAVDVHETVSRRWDELVEQTRKWTSTLVDSDLDSRMVDRLASQASLVRSPTCFRGADGRFYGYEGSLGASTVMWTGHFGGSCPLNCTHVWQYEAALAAMWPALELNMRDTEFDVMQAPNGSIPHRLRVPTYLPQMWDERIGGPTEPALDGMFATILKSLRDVQQGAGVEWLETRWPDLIRLYRHILDRWADDSNVLRGVQPSTHDIDLAGVNSFMGSLWLASLRALEEMAYLVGDSEIGLEAKERFARASAAYDDIMFDGTQYIQVLDEGDTEDFQWLTGTLSDQVIGQWWAHQLGLGHILPKEHVRSALRHVVSTNLRDGFENFEHPYRIYADAADDRGLLMCSWPSGGRPEVPTRYSDEVWSGIEYQVAAHCLYEGLEEEGLAILDALWTRHDGRRRNPYNEIECGDHYVRAMAGWTVLPAFTGVRHDGQAGTLEVRRDGRFPLLTHTGFGSVTVDGDDVSVTCVSGTIAADVFRVDGDSRRAVGRVEA